MRFKTLKGGFREITIANYRIDWAGKSLSLFQRGVKDFLRVYWKHDVVLEELRVAGTRMSLDLYNATKRIAVEVQGRQHTQYVKFMSGNRDGYRNQIIRDLDKAKWCELNGITLIEIFPEDLPLTRDFFKTKFDIIL